MEKTYSKTENNIFFSKSLVAIILSNQEICDMIKTILQHKAECVNIFDRGYSKPMIHYATENGNSLLVEKLLNWGIDVNTTDNEGQTALHAVACTKNNFEKISQTVKILLNSRAVDINKQDNSGRSPLHLALQRDNSLSEMYIHSGANIEAQDDHSERPIHYAVMYKNPKGIALLARHGADVNAQNVFWHNPLMHFLWLMKLESIESNDPLFDPTEMLQELLKLDISTDHRNCMKASVISMVIQDANRGKHNFYTVCLSSILNSSNINSQDGLGFCPIHYIVLNCNLEMFKELLTLGCDINCVDSCGRTALHLIPLCYSILEKEFASVFQKKTEKIIFLKQICQTFLQNGASIHIPDVNGRLPLHSAIEFGQMDVVDLLLSQEDSKAALDVGDKTGMVPLHIAASTNQCEIIILLLKKGASINAVDIHKAAPLHFACFAGYSEAVKTLLLHGPNVSSKDVQCNSAMNFAELRKFHKCAQMIKNHHNVLAKEEKKQSVDYVAADSIHKITMNLEHQTASPYGLWKFSTCLSHHLVNEINKGITQQHSHMDKKDFIIEEQPFPDLPLQSLSIPFEDVLSCLYTTPGVGLVTTDMPEVNEISSAIIVFLEEVFVNVANIDPHFKGTLIPSGSFIEGTKVGDPDEFDFMVNLDYFSELNIAHSDRSIMISEDPNTIQDIRKFVLFRMDSPYLDGQRIVEEFQILFQKALGMSVQHLHQYLQVTAYRIGVSMFMLEKAPRKIHSCPLQCIWNGPLYKGLCIDIDIVPVIKFRGLPATVMKSRYQCEQSSSCMAHYVLPHFLSARMSFSVAEQNIFSKLPEPLHRAFVYAKMLRHRCLIPKFECAIVKMFKENEIWSRDPTQTISTYLLKTILFHMWDDMKENLDSPIHCLERIYQEVETVVKGKPIYSYFMKSLKLDTDVYETNEMMFLHRAYGVLFCELFSKYVKRN